MLVMADTGVPRVRVICDELEFIRQLDVELREADELDPFSFYRISALRIA